MGQIAGFVGRTRSEQCRRNPRWSPGHQSGAAGGGVATEGQGTRKQACMETMGPSQH
jgi:hypothetical protein